MQLFLYDSPQHPLFGSEMATPKVHFPGNKFLWRIWIESWRFHPRRIFQVSRGPRPVAPGRVAPRNGKRGIKAWYLTRNVFFPNTWLVSIGCESKEKLGLVPEIVNNQVWCLHLFYRPRANRYVSYSFLMRMVRDWFVSPRHERWASSAVGGGFPAVALARELSRN